MLDILTMLFGVIFTSEASANDISKSSPDYYEASDRASLLEVLSALLKIISTVVMVMFMSSKKGVSGRKCCVIACYLQMVAALIYLPVIPTT